MVVSLLIVSILLHIVTFFWLIVLMQRIRSLQTSQPETAKEEIEETLTAYLLEMKEENDQFLAKFKSMETKEIKPAKDYSNDVIQEGKMGSDQEVTNQQTQNIKAEDLDRLSEAENDSFEENDYDPPISEKKETFKPSTTSEALRLHKEGLNATEIAKKLNKGQGEIELLIKFHQKK